MVIAWSLTTKEHAIWCTASAKDDSHAPVHAYGTETHRLGLDPYGFLAASLLRCRSGPNRTSIFKYSYSRMQIAGADRRYCCLPQVDLEESETLKNAGDLRSYTRLLAADQNIRLIANRNDVLLAHDDVNWLEETFDPTRLTLFEKGGHLGNLGHRDVQQAILDAMADLKD